MDREAWRAAVRGVAKSWTRLSDRTDETDIKQLAKTSWGGVGGRALSLPLLMCQKLSLSLFKF